MASSLHLPTAARSADQARQEWKGRWIGDCRRLIIYRRQVDTCMISKSTRLTFGDMRVRAKAPLELIHSDLAGPFQPSHTGYTYYLTIVDDFCKTRRQPRPAYERRSSRDFKSVIPHLENQLDHRVKVIRTDGARSIRAPLGISTSANEVSCIKLQPHTRLSEMAWQNGGAERRNRTLKEVTGAILRDSRLGHEFWAAVGYCTALLNRLRIGEDGVSVWERVLKRRGDISESHLYGWENRKKDDLTIAKAWKGRLVGLPIGSSGWMILHPESKQIGRSRDVKSSRQEMTFSDGDNKVGARGQRTRGGRLFNRVPKYFNDPITSDATDFAGFAPC